MRICVRSCSWFAVCCLMVVLSLPYSLPVHAQSADSMEEVVVTSTRLPGEPVSSDQFPGRVEVISGEELRKKPQRTVAHALQQLPGFTMRDDGGNEYDQVLGVRGFSDGQDVLYLIDGIRVNDRGDNGIDFQALPPVEAIRKIEVIYGPSSSQFGEGAQSATVNILTRDEVKEDQLSIGGGSYSHVDGSLTKGFDLGKWNGVLVGRAQDRDGYRDNSASSLENGMLNLKRRFGSGEVIEFNTSWNHSRVGAPNALTDTQVGQDRRQTQTPDDYREVDHELYRLNYRRHFDNGFELNASLNKQNRETFFHSTSIVFGSLSLISSEEDINGLQLEGSYPAHFMGLEHQLSGGIEYDRTRKDYVDAGDFPADRTDEKEIEAIYLDDRIDLNDRLTLFGGVRFDQTRIDVEDDQNDTEFHFSYDPETVHSGLSYDVSDGLRVYGQYGEAFIPPSFGDIAQFGGGFVNFNPDIEPEQNDQIEVGAEYIQGSNSLSLTWFEIETEDEIVFNSTSSTNENLDETEREGIELSGEWWVQPRWKLSANYTYLDAEISRRPTNPSQVGNDIPMVPDHRATATLEYQPSDALSVAVDGLYVDEQFVQSDNDNGRDPLEAYEVVDLTADWSFTRRGSLNVSVKNLFDQHYSSRAVLSSGTVYFSPAPERRAELTISYTF